MIHNLQKNKVGKRKMLATHLYPDSYISEQYRTIRTNIQFINGIKKNQSILVTSPEIKEGKSITSINLAISLAQQKERVLLIDSNLKNPSIHTAFNINNSFGLTDILKGTLSLEETIVKTEIARLELLTSGQLSYNSSELIGSRAMFDLLKMVVNKYDIVLIDSPPILKSSDTKILSNLCDGVVLVIKSGKTETNKAIETKRLLEIAKARIIGVVINSIK
ncbi:CpsD/CapB family tyrosine-protein kinase [Bacillus sp. 1P02SD]|uniref:CpsD/CapB family tyrosine-protein kinase n=1 Tax=Bacillus sp. 1P02SD TaxID=3132264 RepID=UPI0039A14170